MQNLRDKLLRRRVFPWICRRKKPGKEAEKIENVLKRMRWKVEGVEWSCRISLGMLCSKTQQISGLEAEVSSRQL